MLHHRHQLDVREAEVADVLAELLGELAVARGPAATSRGAPRRSRSARASGSDARAPLEPVRVAPLVPRRRRRPRPSAADARSRARTGRPSGAPSRPGSGSRTCSARPPRRPAGRAPRCPDAPSERIWCRRPSQLLKSPTTLTERAFGAQTANAVPADAVDLAHVRAELLVQPLVQALGGEVDVELAERRQEAVRIVELDRRGRPGRRRRAGSGAAASPGDQRPRRPRRDGAARARPARRRRAATRIRSASGRNARTTTPSRRRDARRAGGAGPDGRAGRPARLRPRCSRARLARVGARSPPPGPIPSRGGWPTRTAARRPPSRARRSAAAARSSRAPGGCPRACDGLQVAVEEVLAGALLDALVRRRPATRRGVGERAQHPGDVAQRRVLEPPLGQRPRRLALEVDHEPVVLRPRAPGRGGGRRGGGCACRPSRPSRARAAASARASPRPTSGAVTSFSGSVRNTCVDLLVDGGREQGERLLARLLGRERGVVGLGREHGVHLADHLAEPPRAADERRRVGRRAPAARASSRRPRPARTPARSRATRSSASPRTTTSPTASARSRTPCVAKKWSISSSGFTPASTRR